MALHFVDSTCHPFGSRVASVVHISFNEYHESLYFSTILGDIVHFDVERRHSYSHFQAHAGNLVALKAHRLGVVSASQNKIALHSAGGLLETSWDIDNVESMSTSKVLSSNIFVGTADSVHYLSMRSRKALGSLAMESPVKCIAATDLIYAGQESGSIVIIDPRSMNVINSMELHAAGVSAMWVEDQLLVTAGYTYKQEMQIPDNSVRVYDIRAMKMVMPWTVPAGASSVKISNLPSKIIYALSPLSYQIASVNLNHEALMREVIPLGQNDDALCFDVSANDDYIAYGTISGSVNILCKSSSFPSINTMSEPLQYPGESFAQELSPTASRSSNFVGDDRFWGRTSSVFDSRLFPIAQFVDGLGYARNDRGILQSQVHVMATAVNGTANSSGPSFGLTTLDSDVTFPHWNQLIRALGQVSFIYDFVIDHCNSQACRFKLCSICELGLIFRSLDVSSAEPLHIQNFLQALSVDTKEPASPENGEVAIHKTIEALIRSILLKIPAIVRLQCRSCKFTIPWDHIININRVQGTFLKSLSTALESSLKQRSWCETCQGYRDFILSKASLESHHNAITSAIFIIDPSVYRPFHEIDDCLSLNKDLTKLYLKALLVETHPSVNTTDNLSLRTIFKKDGRWLKCQNEFIGVEQVPLAKLRPIIMFFDSSNDLPHRLIRLRDSPCTSISYPCTLGLDAEYVFYDKAQIEFYSDGSQQILKPKKTRLARLSVVVANTEQVLIDDYVPLEPLEIIADYCSHISGITEDDLLPKKSQHKLTDRKTLTMKLQSLIDSKCKIIGHGLGNDFRVFNISIDQRQVLDTVRLFHMPGSRSLSLKFLTWYFFQESIQSEEHDSVIDAKMAVRLYRKYEELKSSGPDRLNDIINDLYAVGSSLEWQPPKMTSNK